jgi:hypothetical protein
MKVAPAMYEIVPSRRVAMRASVPDSRMRDERWTRRQTVLFAVASSLGLWAAIIGGLRLLLA